MKTIEKKNAQDFLEDAGKAARDASDHITRAMDNLTSPVGLPIYERLLNIRASIDSAVAALAQELKDLENG